MDAAPIEDGTNHEVGGNDVIAPEEIGIDLTTPRAMQIIHIPEEGDRFELREEVLAGILAKIPPDMKVSIVSVAGEFRTGKSFLLDFMLRWLRYHGKDFDGGAPDFNASWFTADGSQVAGQAEVSEDHVQSDATAGHSGFSWRYGRKRCTTGIWLWNEPFFREIPGSANSVPETVAVLLMDTQGMFDHDTSPALTAAIFGLSALISSYQIFNLQNRLREDQLQNITLFMEYGRLALRSTYTKEELQSLLTDAPVPEGSKAAAGADSDSDDAPPRTSLPRGKRPFQVLEFLVRDAQFDDPGQLFQIDRASSAEGHSTEGLEAQMQSYITDVLDRTGVDELADVRETLRSCFDDIHCFQLPRPGDQVVEDPSYDGSVTCIRQSFRLLLHRYMQSTFQENLVAKRIHGRFVTASELQLYVAAFARVFSEKGQIPEPRMLVDAIAEANNTSAKSDALDNYKREMDAFAGIGKGFVAKEALIEHHKLAYDAALAKFDGLANFGKIEDIREFRDALKVAMEEMFLEYDDRNQARDPFKNIVAFVLPALLLVGAYLIRVLIDTFCSPWSTVCSRTSDFLSLIYLSILFLGLIFVATAGRAAFDKVGHLANVLRSLR